MSDHILPGVFVGFKDGGLVAPTAQPTTERVLIIGNALDGPNDTPVTVSTMAEAQQVFGPVVYKGAYLDPKDSTASGRAADNNLVKALHETLLGGGGNVLCVRVGGHKAAAVAAFGGVDLTARYAGYIYNSVSVILVTGVANWTITIDQPDIKGGNATYTFDAATTLGDVVHIVNNDANNTTVTFTVPVSGADLALSTLAAGTVPLVGGTNGTSAPGEDYYASKNGIYTLLTQDQGTFEALIDQIFDHCVLACLNMDDQVVDGGAATTTTAGQAFAQFIYDSSRSYPCLGYIGVRPLQLTTPMDCVTYVTANMFNTVAAFANQPARQIKIGTFMAAGFIVSDSDSGALVDGGGKVNVVLGPDVLLAHPDLGPYVANGAAVYDGLASGIPAKDATTYEALGQVPMLSGSFPKSLHEKCSQGVGFTALQPKRNGGGAYVTFRVLPDDNRPTVVNDVTAAKRGSDYEQMQITRIGNVAAHLIRAAVKPFLGRGLDVQARLALHQAVSNALNALYQAGAVIGPDGVGYNFAITSDPTATRAAKILVACTLRPSIQLKEVDVQVAMTI